jgi:cytochrome b
LHLYRVWDPVQRIFHWLNAACLFLLMAIGTAILWDKELGVSADGKILLKTVHVWIGYVFASNLTVRLVWALVGGPFSRWRAFLPLGAAYFRSLRSYLTASGPEAPRYLGHSPPGRLMVTFLLLLLIVQAGGGLVLAGTDIYYPPFGGFIADWVAASGTDPATLLPGDKTDVDPAAWAEMRAFREPFVEIHELAFFVLLGATFLHIMGVVVAELRGGGGLVSAMITGRKALDRPPADLP